jgi:hypothetical protein
MIHLFLFRCEENVEKTMNDECGTMNCKAFRLSFRVHLSDSIILLFRNAFALHNG